MSAEAPKVSVAFEDGGLGLLTPSGADVQAKIGTSSAGTMNAAALTTRLSGVKQVFGNGQLASALAVALIESKPVIGIRVPASVAGTVSDVVHTGTGTATATLTGEPYDAAAVQATVTRSAASLAAATAAVRLTVNGTDIGERAVPVNGALLIPDTGITLTFSAGTFVQGDTYAFTTTTPGTTLGDITTALEAFLDSRRPVRFIHILGKATPALGAAVDSLLASAEAKGYYTHVVLDARMRNPSESVSDYENALNAEWAGFASNRVSVAREGGMVYNPLTQKNELRPASWPATMRRTVRPVGEDASRVRTGYLRGVTDITVDANINTGVGRFITLMTLDGRQGAYVAAWPMMAPDGSDYDLVQSREVADEAARAGRAAALDYLGDDVPVDPTTGRIDEQEALSIEAFVTGRVQAQLGRNVSGVRVVIDREINILSTRRTEYDIYIIPLGSLREIRVRVGHTNPALAAIQTATPSAETAGNATGGTA